MSLSFINNNYLHLFDFILCSDIVQVTSVIPSFSKYSTACCNNIVPYPLCRSLVFVSTASKNHFPFWISIARSPLTYLFFTSSIMINRCGLFIKSFIKEIIYIFLVLFISVLLVCSFNTSAGVIFTLQ